jgi:hypothetical protein
VEHNNSIFSAEEKPRKEQQKRAASRGQGNTFLRNVMLSTNYMAVQRRSWPSSWPPARENQTEQLPKCVSIYYYSLTSSQVVLVPLQSSFTRRNTPNSEQVKGKLCVSDA